MNLPFRWTGALGLLISPGQTREFLESMYSVGLCTHLTKHQPRARSTVTGINVHPNSFETFPFEAPYEVEPVELSAVSTQPGSCPHGALAKAQKLQWLWTSSFPRTSLVEMTCGTLASHMSGYNGRSFHGQEAIGDFMLDGILHHYHPECGN